MNTGRPVHWDWEAVRSVALTSGLSLAEVALRRLIEILA